MIKYLRLVRSIITLTVLLAIAISLKAQQPDSLKDKGDATIYETAPQPPGGISSFHKFLSYNLNYPKDARKSKIKGQVLVEFMVENDGTINADSVRVIKGIHESLDNEAKRVIGLSPRWIPGTRNGQPIRMRMVIPITFN